jgi:Protein of unknown function (DUF445)
MSCARIFALHRYLRRQITESGRDALKSLARNGAVRALWDEIKRSAIADLADDCSQIRSWTSDVFQRLGAAIAEDRGVQRRLNDWQIAVVQSSLPRARPALGRWIADIVKSWDTEQVTAKLETENRHRPAIHTIERRNRRRLGWPRASCCSLRPETAAQRNDRCLVAPPNLSDTAARRMADKLIVAGLVKEIRARAGAPIWRSDEDSGQAHALKLTAAGAKAIAVDDSEEPGGVHAADSLEHVDEAAASSQQHAARDPALAEEIRSASPGPSLRAGAQSWRTSSNCFSFIMARPSTS